MVKDDISHAEIADALTRIKSSATFRNAPQLLSFLSCVVSKTLAGQQHAIKGYTIATEALGRSDDFDPQTDAIVRVEAGRLRRALDIYYLDQGKADPVRIVIPRGTYVPRFETRGVRPAPAPLSNRPVVAQPGWRGLAATLPASSAPTTSHRLVPTRRAAAVLVVMSSLLVILFALHRNETGWLARAVRAPLGPPSAGITERPVIGTGTPDNARRPAA